MNVTYKTVQNTTQDIRTLQVTVPKREVEDIENYAPDDFDFTKLAQELSEIDEDGKFKTNY